MTHNREQWQGRTVDERYLLKNYLGGSDGRAVFHVQPNDGPADAVIKLIAVDADGERQLFRWETASGLSHPNLIRILDIGRTAMDGQEFFYAVEEFAEENLGQIVPQRPLTPDEVRAMAGPVLDALEYIHKRGLVHARIRPSNILAVADQIKLSSDNLRKPGEVPPLTITYDAPELAAHGVSTATDVWALGMTLAQVLTQHVPTWDPARMNAAELPHDLPEPFRSIVARCLEIDPEKRCDLREVRQRLEPNAYGEVARYREMVASAAVQEPAQSKPVWRHWILPAVVVAAIIFLIARGELSQNRSNEKSSSGTPAAATPQAPVETHPTPASPSQPTPAPSQSAQAPAQKPPAAGDQSAERTETASNSEVVDQVIPKVSPSARRTIEGKIKVRVRVNVGADGSVTNAKLADAGPSKYFARVALEAAQRWKFVSTQDKGGEREWTLHFIFTRARTDVSAARDR